MDRLRSVIEQPSRFVSCVMCIVIDGEGCGSPCKNRRVLHVLIAQHTYPPPLLRARFEQRALNDLAQNANQSVFLFNPKLYPGKQIRSQPTETVLPAAQLVNRPYTDVQRGLASERPRRAPMMRNLSLPLLPPRQLLLRRNWPRYRRARGACAIFSNRCQGGETS